MLQFFSKEFEELYLTFTDWGSGCPPSSCAIARWVAKCVLSNSPFVGRMAAKRKELLHLHLIPFKKDWKYLRAQVEKSLLINSLPWKPHGIQFYHFLLLTLLPWCTLQPFISKWWTLHLVHIATILTRTGHLNNSCDWEMVGRPLSLFFSLEIKFYLIFVLRTLELHFIKIFYFL